MAAQVDDLCLVCADPLEWTAFGPCGHNEVCSRCVARMRFVLKEPGCVFCRQESPAVFFTRFMGDYTKRVAPEEFAELQGRANRRELYALPEISGFFDDEKHFEEIKALCGFTHPALQSGGKGPQRFNNFNALKRHLESTLNQSFCDVCVKGRKVFVSEQLLYSKDALRRHQEAGDESGPLAESGFKGHPLCKFCRTRFYDSNELYRHMESSHEHCFLCRRAAPGQYVYYRHYKELEEHFQKSHHPCPHPECLERKFVVFDTEVELKAHFATEHGDTFKMSAAQRRQALSIPLNLQYRSRDDEETEPGPSARFERAAVVIGGGHNLSSRTQRSGRGAPPQPSGGQGQGLHHSRSEPQFNPEPAAEVSSVTFTAEDFPAPSASGATGGGALGRWAAFAGAQGSAGDALNEEAFPALPSLSKNQRRRLKEQQRTLADRLSAAAQPPRVLNRATPGGGGAAGGPGAGLSSSSFASQAADFPALGGGGGGPPPPQRSAPPPPSLAMAAAPAAQPAVPAAAMFSRSTADLVAPPATQRRPGLGTEDFPTLGGGAGGKGRAPPPPSSPPPATSAYSGVASGQVPASPSTGLTQTDVLSSLFMRPGSAAALAGQPGGGAASGSAAGASASSSTPGLTTEDFPSLPAGKPRGKSAKTSLFVKKAPNAAASSNGAAAARAAAPEPAPAPSPSGGRGGSGGGGGGGGVSDRLKAANKQLVERIKRQLSGSAFDTFRQQSLLFMRGELGAEEYHGYMVSLGLLSLVAELVSLCPEASKRRQLLRVHRAFILSPAAQDPSLVGAGWMPPEAAVAKADRVALHSSWSCPRCALCNAPDDAKCEGCKAPRPPSDNFVDDGDDGEEGWEAPKKASPAAAAAAAAARPASLAAALTASSSRPAVVAAAAPPPAQPAAPPSADDFPSLPLASGKGRGAGLGGSVRGGGGSLEDLAGLDLGRADSGGPDGAAGNGGGGKGKKSKGTTIRIGMPQPVHPQNVWTQPGHQAKAKQPNQWKAGAGKVAQMHGAINDAWGN